MKLTKEILDLIVLLTDRRINPLIDMTPVKGIDPPRILDITTSADIFPLSDHVPDQEISDTLNLDHTQTHETNLTPFSHKQRTIVSILKNICITLREWQML